MVEIKAAISFDEYNAIIDKVVNDCFPDGTYYPANYDLSLRTALLCAFAPDFNLSDCDDNNQLWEKVLSDDGNEIINKIYSEASNYVSLIKKSIWEGIEYNIKMTTSGSMSMSDIALSKLFEKLTEKVESIDTSVMTNENINALVGLANTMQSDKFTQNIVDTFVEKISNNKDSDNKNIKLVTSN